MMVFMSSARMRSIAEGTIQSYDSVSLLIQRGASAVDAGQGWS